MEKHAMLLEFGKIVNRMESLKPVRGAEVKYDLMADALYWTDELPAIITPAQDDCLRLVLRYRTSLITNTPDVSWKEYWDEALHCFPSWIGFLPGRCSPNEHLIRRLEHFRSASGF